MFLSYNGNMTILNVIATSHGTDSVAGREAITLIREQIKFLLAQRNDGMEVPCSRRIRGCGISQR